MKERVRIGIIGTGARGTTLLRNVLLPMAEGEQADVEIGAVCDAYEDRARGAAELVSEHTGRAPRCTLDYRELVLDDTLDAVVILSAWETHVPAALAAMRAGKYVGMEVGGAYSLDDCWKLVETSEETGVPCMLLENCCYGRREMMVLNMVRQGLLGDIVHCAGGYCHDLREEVAYGRENRQYRLRNYLGRNCDNYPTHDLGPIAKVLRINDGNRLLSLTSTASCAKGMHAYVADKKGPDDPLAAAAFAQGDIVTTVLRCMGGETITLSLDTTLPRAYSRTFTVRGTRGAYMEDNDSVFLDGVHNADDLNWKPHWGNAEEYAKTYDHPLWAVFREDIRGGHSGMDWLVIRAFLEAVKAGAPPPLDVYDMATLMCITPLSEQSIVCGSQPVAVPDFTRGAWLERAYTHVNRYSLHIVCADPAARLY